MPGLQEQARVDPKTGLFNARHFSEMLTEELGRAERFNRPLSVVMADLDLLREINNSYGHLAGDAVLKGVAVIFRQHLRHYDVPARFGGEEFAIVLPETTGEQALEIAERIRQSVAEATFEADTSNEPIRATISIGVAGFPGDATDPQGLVHQADLAVYRAKLQGRNRVLAATSEPLAVPEERSPRAVTLAEDGEFREILAPSVSTSPTSDDRRRPRPHAVAGAWFGRISLRLGVLVGLVGTAGIAAGAAGLLIGRFHDVLGLVAVVALVAIGQASRSSTTRARSRSPPSARSRAQLSSGRRQRSRSPSRASRRLERDPPASAPGPLQHRLALARLARGRGIFSLHVPGHVGQVVLAALGLAAGAAYYAVNMGLLSLALAIEGH